MLTLLLTLSLHAAEAADSAAQPDTVATSVALSDLSQRLDAHQLALERVTRWRLRDDLEPAQALCLHARHDEARELVSAARAVEVRLELNTDTERISSDLRSLAAAETRVAATVDRARSCLTCNSGDPHAARCDAAAKLSMSANDLQGHRWHDECSLQQDYVCREVKDGCVCTEATLQDWIGG